MVVGTTVEPVMPPVEALAMTEDEILGTSDTGQTVVVRTMVSVTIMVVFWDSGRLAMPVA